MPPRTATRAPKNLGTPEEEIPPQEPVVIDSGDPDRKWYVIHTYSGYENKVKTNLEHRISTMDVRDRIFQVVIPMEGEVEVKDGQRRTVQRKVFPGYVLVDMKLDDQSWYVVRNTPGVTGFVGSGNKPIPLEDAEVRKILKQMTAEAPRVKIAFEKDQSVRIIDGPFADFIGVVSEILQDKGKVRVMVSFFGRETPIELDFLQVEKL
jgi:transcription termination/antitermination protein NusG